MKAFELRSDRGGLTEFSADFINLDPDGFARLVDKYAPRFCRMEFNGIKLVALMPDTPTPLPDGSANVTFDIIDVLEPEAARQAFLKTMEERGVTAELLPEWQARRGYVAK